MNTNRYRRHDLVWLDPDVDAGAFAVDGQAELVRQWIRQNLPFVVARQPEPFLKEANHIRLGFTLPSAPVRTRIMLRADRAAIVRHTPPLPLLDAMRHAPAAWQAGLERLHALFENTRTVARVYGSLSSQVFTGKTYLDDASDLDLLLECGEDTKLLDLLAGLETMPPSSPRIDGEVLSAGGWAVAWRELAAALRTDAPRQVLAKSDSEARLLDVDAFIQPLLISV